MSWIPNAILYQINLRSLAAREPSNAFEAFESNRPPESPLVYVTRQMSYFTELGVTVLHLMPPYPMGIENRKGIGSPYAARKYDDIDPEWGTLDEFDEFVRTAHKAGLKIIIGMVPNHSSRDHEWISKHPEFYVRNPDGVPSYDLDWSDTAKLDYTQQGLRQAMTEVYDFWLSRPDGAGVDGFRIDMAHFINDLSFWNDALPELKGRHEDRELLFMAECYGTDRNLDLFQRGMNGAYDDTFYKLGQYFYGVDHEGNSRLLETDSDGFSNGDFAHLAHKRNEGGVRAAFLQAIQDYASIDPTQHTPRVARYTDNHDEGRGAYRFGLDASNAMMAVAFFSPNCMPFLLTGQEFGAENRPSIHERVQPCDKGSRVIKDGHIYRRAGVEFEGNIFARGSAVRKTIYEYYHELMKLRLSNPALASGSFTPLMEEDVGAKEHALLSFDRENQNQHLRCRINLSHAIIRFTPASGEGKVISGQETRGELAPFSYQLIDMTKR